MKDTNDWFKTIQEIGEKGRNKRRVARAAFKAAFSGYTRHPLLVKLSRLMDEHTDYGIVGSQQSLPTTPETAIHCAKRMKEIDAEILSMMKEGQ